MTNPATLWSQERERERERERARERESEREREREREAGCRGLVLSLLKLIASELLSYVP